MDAALELILTHVGAAAERLRGIGQDAEASGMSDDEWWYSVLPTLFSLLADRDYPLSGRVGQAIGAPYLDTDYLLRFGSRPHPGRSGGLDRVAGERRERIDDGRVSLRDSLTATLGLRRTRMVDSPDVTAGRSEHDEAGGRRAAIRDLMRHEQRFRLLVDSVLDYAIFLLDVDGLVETWNPGAARLKGYEAHEVIGQHYSIFYPPETRDQGMPARLLAEALEGGRTKYSGWRVRKDGTRFWADVVITALFDDDGRHIGFAKVTRDRTAAHEAELARERALAEQRRLVARLEELDAWRNDFIGSVVHDLQTPVAAINGFVHLLLDGYVDEEEASTVLASVLANTSSLQQLIDNLRAYTVLSERDPPLVRERIELQPFVAQIVTATSPLLGDREVAVAVDGVEATADRHGLERILSNLLSNVARHTPDTTHVTIRARHTDAAAVVEVEDDGGGIPPELLPFIFDRFEHGGKGGTGLGLAIVQRWVELHGGAITVDNEPGRGATFRFTLPDHGLPAHEGPPRG